jgi:hypothetical protein
MKKLRAIVVALSLVLGMGGNGYCMREINADQLNRTLNALNNNPADQYVIYAVSIRDHYKKLGIMGVLCFVGGYAIAKIGEPIVEGGKKVVKTVAKKGKEGIEYCFEAEETVSRDGSKHSQLKTFMGMVCRKSLSSCSIEE